MTLKLGILHWGLRPYKVCSKLWYWVDLDFYSKVKLLCNVFEWENAKTVNFIKTTEVNELNVGTYSRLSEVHVHENLWGPEVMIIILTFVQHHWAVSFHTSSAPKLLSHQSESSCGASVGLGNEKFRRFRFIWQRWPSCLFMVKSL